MNDQNAQSPVLDDKSVNIRYGLLSNAQGEIVLLHDRPFPKDIDWAEYDETGGCLSLINVDGGIQKLALSFDEKMKLNLSKAKQLSLTYMAHRKIQSACKIALVIKV